MGKPEAKSVFAFRVRAGADGRHHRRALRKRYFHSSIRGAAVWSGAVARVIVADALSLFSAPLRARLAYSTLYKVSMPRIDLVRAKASPQRRSRINVVPSCWRSFYAADRLWRAARRNIRTLSRLVPVTSTRASYRAYDGKTFFLPPVFFFIPLLYFSLNTSGRRENASERALEKYWTFSFRLVE